jgi:type I restriction enzyme M protein
VAKKRTSEIASSVEDDTVDVEVGDESEAASIEDGMLVDYITDEIIKDSPKERVRQRIARAIFHEYGFPPSSMERDFTIRVENRNKRVDLAIFKTDAEHTVENLHRVVICKPEAKIGKKGGYKLRDHEQAKKDLDELKDFMEAVESCQWGLWTNGLELFFLQKEKGRFESSFKPMGDWPPADESQGSRSVHSHVQLRRADPDLLRITFRRCHNFIHGNEGMSKDAAFWQFLYLIFAKMYDEGHSNGDRRFWVAPNERFDEAGQKAIRKRIIPLFEDTRNEYSGDAFGNIFRGNEEITLSDRALAFMVSELAKYSFARTDTDAKGAAYQEIVGDTLRGDRGQFFTPSNAVKLMVEILDPKDTERIIDPACGTGGFLRAVLAYLMKIYREEVNSSADTESTIDFMDHQKRLKKFAKKNLFGADFDPSLVRASQMNVVMTCNQMANIFHMNSLEFPHGTLSGVEHFKKKAQLGSMDIVMTNPPFGASIPVTEPQILDQYELGRRWERDGGGGFRQTGVRQGSVAPEILFIERCLQWLRPGGRMGIVLPDGILGNPGDEYIRWWIMRHSYVLASVDLPVECFIVEANVNILTSLLFLKKKTAEEIAAEDVSGPADYPVFMAVAEKVGYDRRGNTLYKRSPDGELLLETVNDPERIKIGGTQRYGNLNQKRPILDDDFPEIARAYREFRKKYPIPGIQLTGGTK